MNDMLLELNRDILSISATRIHQTTRDQQMQVYTL